MNDVSQILAPTTAAVTTLSVSTSAYITPNGNSKPPPPPPPYPPGISKEVMKLLGGKQQSYSSASLPPIVPTLSTSSKSRSHAAAAKNENHPGKEESNGGIVNVKVGNKWITSSKRVSSWTWAPFCSSSRADGAMFTHWVRKNVEYTDYPYAKFDIHMDPITYSSDEYEKYLQSETWTRSETETLLEIVRKYECRWPVIYDRFCGCDATSARNIEDLQYRYYVIGAIISQVRLEKEASKEVQEKTAVAVSLSSSSSLAATASKSVGGSNSNSQNSGVTTSIASVAPSDDVQNQEKSDAVLEAVVARALASSKQSQPFITNVGNGTSNKMYDNRKEKLRRRHLDRLWKRSKEDEVEELELRKELKKIEAQLRKLKKSGGHILAAATATLTATRKKDSISPTSGAGASNRLPKPPSRAPSRSATPVGIVSVAGVAFDPKNANSSSPHILDEFFVTTAPVPTAQYPYLQSERLVKPSGMNKSLLTRMDHVLDELNIASRPIPTKRVCDLYDVVRRDILTLLTLQKTVNQKEGQLQSKRLRLSNLGGTMISIEDKVLGEENLFGIVPPPPLSKPTSSANYITGNSTTSKVRSSKKRGSNITGVGGKVKAARKSSKEPKSAAAATTMAVTAATSGSLRMITTTKKKTVRRKRKLFADSTRSPIPATVSAAPTVPVAAITSEATTAAAPGATELQSNVKKRARKSTL